MTGEQLIQWAERDAMIRYDIRKDGFGGYYAYPVPVEDGNFVKYIDHLQSQRELVDSLRLLLQAISTCHYCGAELIPERGAAHCEDCPSGCESHDAPDCVQLSEIVTTASAALAAAEKEMESDDTA